MEGLDDEMGKEWINRCGIVGALHPPCSMYPFVEVAEDVANGHSTWVTI